MKKILLLVMCAGMLSITAKAQGLKQEAGDKNLEVNFTPLGGNPISIGGIKFRKFNSTGTGAFRVNVFLGSKSSKDITQQADTGGVPELTTKNSSMTISVRPGIEKHMAGTERLSPYCGAEIGITMVTSKEVKEGANNDNTVNKTTTKGADGSLSFGAGLLAGADYYFAKSLYFGAEIGFGFNMTSMSKKKVELSGFPGTTTNPKDEKQGSSFQFGPTFTSAIRLGWLFK